MVFAVFKSSRFTLINEHDPTVESLIVFDLGPYVILPLPQLVQTLYDVEASRLHAIIRVVNRTAFVRRHPSYVLSYAFNRSDRCFSSKRAACDLVGHLVVHMTCKLLKKGHILL
jgi:hypothetical protein